MSWQEKLFAVTVLVDKVLLAVVVAATIYIATRPSPATLDPNPVCHLVKP